MTAASLLSRWLRCWRAASQQLIDPATLADAKLESTLMHEWKQQEAPLPHCRFEKSRQASPSLWTDKAKSPCVWLYAGLPRRRTTTRSRTVRLNSKLSKATLTSRTEEIRRQNIRLNSCSFTLKERPDSDDMVRQKSSKKQRKSLAGDAGMLTFCKVRDRGSGVPAATCVGMLRYSMTTTRKVKDLCSPRGAKKKVFLGTSSTVTLLEKITPGMSDSFETLQEYFWTIDA